MRNVMVEAILSLDAETHTKEQYDSLMDMQNFAHFPADIRNAAKQKLAELDKMNETFIEKAKASLVRMKKELDEKQQQADKELSSFKDEMSKALSELRELEKQQLENKDIFFEFPPSQFQLFDPTTLVGRSTVDDNFRASSDDVLFNQLHSDSEWVPTNRIFPPHTVLPPTWKPPVFIR